MGGEKRKREGEREGWREEFDGGRDRGRETGVMTVACISPWTDSVAALLPTPRYMEVDHTSRSRIARHIKRHRPPVCNLDFHLLSRLAAFRQSDCHLFDWRCRRCCGGGKFCWVVRLGSTLIGMVN